MNSKVTVAVPILNPGRDLASLLTAVTAQQWKGEVEVLVCDSGSTDGSVQLARNLGAKVIEIDPARFSHGGTRNLLMEHSTGEYVAFLTQDSWPANELWLDRLVGGFAAAADVGLAFGPYRPRPAASPMVARELTEWFERFAPGGQLSVDRLADDEIAIPTRALLGRRGFFTDANGCVARSAWTEVPFRPISYAEDHALAHDMLRAGYAKVFVPDAAVIHSHEYTNWGWLQRSFDEARALHELYGWRPPLDTRTVAVDVWGMVGADWRWAGSRSGGSTRSLESVHLLARSTLHHLVRSIGTLLGARADRLSPAVIRFLSREGRAR